MVFVLLALVSCLASAFDAFCRTSETSPNTSVSPVYSHNSGDFKQLDKGHVFQGQRKEFMSIAQQEDPVENPAIEMIFPWSLNTFVTRNVTILSKNEILVSLSTASNVNYTNGWVLKWNSHNVDIDVTQAYGVSVTKRRSVYLFSNKNKIVYGIQYVSTGISFSFKAKTSNPSRLLDSWPDEYEFGAIYGGMASEIDKLPALKFEYRLNHVKDDKFWALVSLRTLTYSWKDGWKLAFDFPANQRVSSEIPFNQTSGSVTFEQGQNNLTALEFAFNFTSSSALVGTPANPVVFLASYVDLAGNSKAIPLSPENCNYK